MPCQVPDEVAACSTGNRGEVPSSPSSLVGRGISIRPVRRLPRPEGNSYGTDARCELFHRGDRGDNRELCDWGTLVWTLVREDVDGRLGEDRGGQGGDAKAGAERVRSRARWFLHLLVRARDSPPVRSAGKRRAAGRDRRRFGRWAPRLVRVPAVRDDYRWHLRRSPRKARRAQR